MSIRRWFDDNLICPYDGGPLTAVDQRRVCPSGHDFPVVHGVPVILRSDLAPTHHLWRTTAEDVARHSAGAPADEGAGDGDGTIDPFVERWLVATCGLLYRGHRKPLVRYPIPDIGLPPGEGRSLLDVGSNWGRWALAAARAGYRVVALDPSLEATLAGTRIARQLDLPVDYVVGDVRHLPFRADAFDVGYSYSVLQHMDKAVVHQALGEISRVVRGDGAIHIQMANVLGARRLFKHAQELLRSRLGAIRGRQQPPYPFRVRAWTPWAWRRIFAERVGPPTLAADGFFSLDAQASDVDLVRRSSALVIRLSGLLCAISARLPGLRYLADSVMLSARNGKTPLTRTSR